MSQVTGTTTTTPPVTVVCSRTPPITMAVKMASISIGLAASDQHDGILPQQLIQKDTVWSSVGITTLPQQQQSQSQMPS